VGYRLAVYRLDGPRVLVYLGNQQRLDAIYIADIAGFGSRPEVIDMLDDYLGIVRCQDFLG